MKYEYKDNLKPYLTNWPEIKLIAFQIISRRFVMSLCLSCGNGLDLTIFSII